MNMSGLGVLLQGYSGMGNAYGKHFPDDYNGAPAMPFGALGDLDPNAVLWPSRDILANETAKLQAATKQLASDWFANGANVTQEQLTRWNSFVSDLKAWDWGPAFLAHIIDATWRDELLTFQSRFNSFADEFRQASVSVTVPDFTFTAAPPSTLDKLADKATKPLADAANTFKWLGIGAGVVIIGYVFFLTHETSRVGRALAPLGGGLVRNPRRRRRSRR